VSRVSTSTESNPKNRFLCLSSGGAEGEEDAAERRFYVFFS